MRKPAKIAGLTKTRLADVLLPFRDRVSEGGLGSVPEIFDGDAPHRPSGCPFQAWSVAIESTLMGRTALPAASNRA
ncbi:MAG: amylo-alpha-1,6-glucosidase [Gemmatimonadota bacterium]